MSPTNLKTSTRNNEMDFGMSTCYASDFLVIACIQVIHPCSRTTKLNANRQYLDIMS